MFALGIRYLNGWSMATHPADRTRAEWPPHPDRVFMALAAAYYETDGGEEQQQVLEWLESLPAPELAVSEKFFLREVVTSYVPVNDTEIARRGTEDKRLNSISQLSSLDKAKDSGLALLPELRRRQARQFPVAIPEFNAELDGSESSMPRVYLIWEAELPAEFQDPLERLCMNVTSIGHSASLVQMWVEASPPQANLKPVADVAAKHRLRISGTGRLGELNAQYVANLRPTSSIWQSYGNKLVPEASIEKVSSVFDSNLLMLPRLSGPRLGLESTLLLTTTLRDAVIAQCEAQPPPEWISGHQPDGSPSQQAHLAFLPLPHVGREHAEGHLLGLAIVVPKSIPADEQRYLGSLLFDARGYPRELDVRLGKYGIWKLAFGEADETRQALQSERWTSSPDGARRWASVTPIVFDRHPKKPGEGEETIAISCERVGLPRPQEVILSPVSMFIGVPHSRRFPNMQRKSGGNLHHTHAIVVFKEPIVGPLLLGAGRYRGYGLCRPLSGGGLN